jgi:hypothetical protein
MVDPKSVPSRAVLWWSYNVVVIKCT